MSGEKRPLSSGRDVTLSDRASCVRFWGSWPSSSSLFFKSQGSSMAAPLDSEDDVSTSMSKLEHSDRPAML